MRHIIDKALLSFIGRVNKAVFSASRGRLVLYRFHGRPGLLLGMTGPAAPVGETVGVGYLPDGDDYIVLAAETDTRLPAALRTAASATVELARRPMPVDITMLTDDPGRTALLKRLLGQASVGERHEVTRRREVPIARLTPHHKPTFDGSVAFSGLRLT